MEVKQPGCEANYSPNLVRSQLQMHGAVTSWSAHAKTFITNTTRPELTYTLASFHDLICIKMHFRRWLYIINI